MKIEFEFCFSLSIKKLCFNNFLGKTFHKKYENLQNKLEYGIKTDSIYSEFLFSLKVLNFELIRIKKIVKHLMLLLKN
jgi:hypothetical protein